MTAILLLYLASPYCSSAFAKAIGYFPVILPPLDCETFDSIEAGNTHHWYAYHILEIAANLGPGYLAAGWKYTL